MNRPLCFVLMPFGEKKDASGVTIDFNAVYEKLIKPAVIEAGMDPIRADEEQVGGIIHKPMFERLVLCDYAVADLTTANANVFYELGVRHAARPYSTALMYAGTTRLPFDLGPMRALPYSLTGRGKPERIEETRAALVKCLLEARERNIDSPLFQLVEGMRPQEIDHKKTDVFREGVLYSQKVKDRLALARKSGAAAVAELGKELGDVKDLEAGILIDLLLSHRAVKDWNAMIDLVERMPEPLRKTVMVREQLAFALNRAGRGEEAERVLLDLIAERGPSSETNGLLGRVYKDRWEASLKQGEERRICAVPRACRSAPVAVLGSAGASRGARGAPARRRATTSQKTSATTVRTPQAASAQRQPTSAASGAVPRAVIIDPTLSAAV